MRSSQEEKQRGWRGQGICTGTASGQHGDGEEASLLRRLYPAFKAFGQLLCPPEWKLQGLPEGPYLMLFPVLLYPFYNCCHWFYRKCYYFKLGHKLCRLRTPT